MSEKPRAALLALAGLLWPAAALAHAVNVPPLDALRIGATFALTAPHPVLAALSLAVAASGAHPRRQLLGAWAAYVLGLVAGMAAGGLGLLRLEAEPLLLPGTLAVAALTALSPTQAGRLAPALALAGGGILGLYVAPPADERHAFLLLMSASAATASALLLVAVSGAVAALLQRIARPWAVLVPRVLAAWTVAIAGLMLALSLS